jgi:hypothetical protein
MFADPEDLSYVPECMDAHPNMYGTYLDCLSQQQRTFLTSNFNLSGRYYPNVLTCVPNPGAAPITYGDGQWLAYTELESI